MSVTSGLSEEAYTRLDTFATGGPDPDIETLRADVLALLDKYDRITCHECREPVAASPARTEPGETSP